MFRGYSAVSGLGEAAAVPAQAPAEATNQPFEQVGKYVFKKTLAAKGNAGDGFDDLAQIIDKISDFVWLSVCAISTGAFSVNFKDNGGRELFSSQAQAANVIGTGQFPVPMGPPGLFYPAGGRIGIALANLTDAQNDIEIVFIGIKRFRTQR